MKNFKEYIKEKFVIGVEHPEWDTGKIQKGYFTKNFDITDKLKKAKKFKNQMKAVRYMGDYTLKNFKIRIVNAKDE